MMRRRMVLAAGIAVAGSAALALPTPSPASAHRPQRRIAMVMTSVGAVPGDGRPTGLWWSEFAEPFAVFEAAGMQVVAASIKGGPVPIDPRSGGEVRARRDGRAWSVARDTVAVDRVHPEAIDGLFLAGGHGTMWDFPDNPALSTLITAAIARGVPVGAVCHGPAGLIGPRQRDGSPLVAGRRVNGFTNAEEAAAGMTEIVPFLLETRLRALGAQFEHAGVFAAHAVRDGMLITGQNPASSIRTAELVLEAMAAAVRSEG